MKAPSVSIVVIARNEEGHIGKSLGATVREASSVGGETVFVDSGSTDRTLDVALGFPVKAVKMDSSNLLTAAAARQVGFVNSTGEIVLFVDGDCVLAPGWAKSAVAALTNSRGIAGVRGRLDEVYLHEGNIVGGMENRFVDSPKHPVSTLSVGGNAAFLRSALEEVGGGFNPFIRSQEEADLCFRLMKKGLRVLAIPEKMATHYTEKRWTFATVFGRFVHGLCTGYGQVLRSAVRHGFLRGFVRQESRTFLFMGACVAGIAACTLDLLGGTLLWSPLWVAAMLVPFAYMAIKNRNAKWPALMYLTWFLNCLGMVYGLAKALPNTTAPDARVRVFYGEVRPKTVDEQGQH